MKIFIRKKFIFNYNIHNYWQIADTYANVYFHNYNERNEM